MRDLGALVVDRPLAFIDLETTGVSIADDRIVEIGVVIVYPLPTDGSEPKMPWQRSRRVNPGMPIPAEATAVHGITDADVAQEPTFREIANALRTALEPCDLAGFNLRRFDLPMLRAELRRCGLSLDHTTRRLIDLQQLYHQREPRDLAAAVRFYTGREHVGGHSAESDTFVLLELLESQLQRYPDLPCNLDALHAACNAFAPFRTEVEAWFGDDLKNPVFQRGKSVKGMTLDEVLKTDPGFIGWMLNKAEDMDEEVKEFVRRRRQEIDYRDTPRPAAPATPVQSSLGV